MFAPQTSHTVPLDTLARLTPDRTDRGLTPEPGERPGAARKWTQTCRIYTTVLPNGSRGSPVWSRHLVKSLRGTPVACSRDEEGLPYGTARAPLSGP